jgi:D-methionine transport system ATP-binding protein
LDGAGDRGMIAPTIPQIKVERVSFAPRVFRSIKLTRQEFATANLQFVLRDLSFEVFPGDRVAVVGAAGAGKTTLFRLLNRLSEPTKGTFFWQGKPYTEIQPVYLRQQIGLVLREPKLLGMTVQESLNYPLQLQKLSQKIQHERLNEWRERLKIPANWLDRTEAQLSLAERQWVAIARAFVAQPGVLLLDEPTAALDFERSQLLLQTLSELAENSRTTVFMVNHQREIAEQFCRRILHLQAGVLVTDQPSDRALWDFLPSFEAIDTDDNWI